MNERYMYDRNGNYIGKSSDRPPYDGCGPLVLFGLACYGVWKFLYFLAENETFFVLLTAGLVLTVFVWKRLKSEKPHISAWAWLAFLVYASGLIGYFFMNPNLHNSHRKGLVGVDVPKAGKH